MALIVTQVNDLLLPPTRLRAETVFQVVPKIGMGPIVLIRVRVRVAIDSRAFAIVMEMIVIKVSCSHVGERDIRRWTRERDACCAVCVLGVYSRTEIDSRCSLSSSNLPVLIIVPIVSVLVVVAILGGLFYWRMKRSRQDEKELFQNSSLRFSSNENFSSDADQFNYPSNPYQIDSNILSERL